MPAKQMFRGHLTLPLFLQNLDFTSEEAASERSEAAESSQSSGRTRNVGTVHTTSPGARECPSAHRCCSGHICAPTRTRCVALPRCGSTGLHTCLATMSPPA
jgi:hypothetical protein